VLECLANDAKISAKKMKKMLNDFIYKLNKTGLTNWVPSSVCPHSTWTCKNIEDV